MRNFETVEFPPPSRLSWANSTKSGHIQTLCHYNECASYRQSRDRALKNTESFDQKAHQYETNQWVPKTSSGRGSGDGEKEIRSQRARG